MDPTALSIKVYRIILMVLFEGVVGVGCLRVVAYLRYDCCDDQRRYRRSLSHAMMLAGLLRIRYLRDKTKRDRGAWLSTMPNHAGHTATRPYPILQATGPCYRPQAHAIGHRPML